MNTVIDIRKDKQYGYKVRCRNSGILCFNKVSCGENYLCTERVSYGFTNYCEPDISYKFYDELYMLNITLRVDCATCSPTFYDPTVTYLTSGNTYA